jgi:predicted acylesterase/phospholipase RssA
LANLFFGVSNAKYCRGIAFGGDALRGPYQAGVLQGLIEDYPADEVSFDIATGVGVGAFNAIMLSRFGQGEEKMASDYITNFW